MRRLVAVLVVMVMAVGACTGDDSGDERGSEATEASARAQLEWALGSGATATDDELGEHFDASFFEEVPRDDVRAVLGNLAGATITEVTSFRGGQLVAVVTDTIGVRFTATLVVEADGPHRVLGLHFAQADLPDPPESWDEVDRRLSALAERGFVFAAEVDDDGTVQVIHDRGADQVAPIGSIFKLYVLGALVEAVRAGDVGWDDEITIEPGDVSLGGLAARVGEAVPIREVARLMIAQSDNTAADAVLRTVGRGAVEAMLEPMGMGAASRARTLPFLTAREAFIVKWGTRAADYPPADEPERRAILAELDEPMPNLLEVDTTKPAEIDRVEWFATAAEVVAAHLWLDAARIRPEGAALAEILGSGNPGLVLDAASWRGGAFKGGSEPGVLALSWLLVRHDGRGFVAVTMSSSPTHAIDDAEGASIGRGVVDLLARVD